MGRLEPRRQRGEGPGAGIQGHARLSAAGDKDLGVPLGSTIGALTPTTQSELIQALAPIVMSALAPAPGGSSAVDIAGPVGYFCARSISS